MEIAAVIISGVAALFALATVHLALVTAHHARTAKRITDTPYDQPLPKVSSRWWWYR